ncbi:heparinase II/III family protein [Acidimicrobiaceae bacterium]|nr:heparinase II/III family protein [Acidimicrobiaceae bacterium]
MIRYLRKFKYEINNLFKKPPLIPDTFDQGKWKDKSKVYDLLATIGKDLTQDLNLIDMKIFGESVNNNWIVGTDFFKSYDFSNKKLKPAFFNIADVKVPYEASRLQHLQKQNLINSVEATKTLGSGALVVEVDKFPLIYWNSPMDVAIRLINLIIHRQFLAHKSNRSIIFDDSEELLDAYISQNYQYVKDNLENEGKVVGNHYLIELSSMLFYLANYETKNSVADTKFVIEELKIEIARQFNDEGTNFEGSTHYSAFATEALILCKLSMQELNQSTDLLTSINRLILSNKKFLSLLINNDELSQIGDNDSGRIFYFAFEEEKPLKLSWLIKMIESLEINEKLIISDHIFEVSEEIPILKDYKHVKHPEIKVFSKDYEAYAYPEFGIFIWRNESEYLSIRCGPVGQNGVGGHSHYDQLSIECFTNDKWIARDPGTGTYTDDITIRNKFKSLEYHWGPNINIKFKKEDEFDCFKLNNMSDGNVLTFNKESFLGVAEFNGNKIYRKMELNDGVLSIEDFSKLQNLQKYDSWGEKTGGVKRQFSEGYKRFS